MEVERTRMPYLLGAILDNPDVIAATVIDGGGKLIDGVGCQTTFINPV